MVPLRRFLLRLYNFLRPSRAEQELARELTSHLALLEDHFHRQGMTPEQARLAAARATGGIERAKELHRDARSFVWLKDARLDLVYGVRLLRRQPGFAALAILTMALGIGATTLLFSVAYGVLLKPMPWANADRILRVTETRQGRTGRVAGTVSNGTFLAWRDRPATIEDLGGWLTSTGTLSGIGDPVRISFKPTTPSVFSILRVRPLLGRLFNEGEGKRRDPG